MAPSVPNHRDTVSRRKHLGSSEEPRTKVSGSFSPTLQHSGPFQHTERKDRGLSCGREGGGEPCPPLCDSTMPLSPQEAAGCKPSQPCRLQGMTPRWPEGRATSVPAVPFTRIHTPASLHCCTSVYPPLWSTECLGRHPIFGAQLTPHTHGHQVPPVRSYDDSFRRRGLHRVVCSVTLGSSRAGHPRVTRPCSAPTLLLLQAEEELESSPGVPLGPCPAASPPACPRHMRQTADIPGSRDRPGVTAQVPTSLKEQGQEVTANTKQYGRLYDQNVAPPLVTTSLTPTFKA